MSSPESGSSSRIDSGDHWLSAQRDRPRPQPADPERGARPPVPWPPWSGSTEYRGAPSSTRLFSARRRGKERTRVHACRSQSRCRSNRTAACARTRWLADRQPQGTARAAGRCGPVLAWPDPEGWRWATSSAAEPPTCPFGGSLQAGMSTRQHRASSPPRSGQLVQRCFGTPRRGRHRREPSTRRSGP